MNLNNVEKSVRKCKVFVGNLTSNVQENHLKEIFDRCGNVIKIDIPFDKKLKRHKGFAYIQFERAEEAEKAITLMHKGQIDGQIVSVEHLK